ncbi:histidine--tRNA ligase [Candidatus Uhrbacteria bacterium]|nr:histidine--tRNA ligase [Candidatus Uhrbacteria bacterium]
MSSNRAPKHQKRVSTAPFAAVASANAAVVAAPTGGGPQLVRGMRDVLPSEQAFWRRLYDASVQEFDVREFDRIETPILEEVSLFQRSIGKVTDVIEKEMYAFEDPGGARVALRPEATASVARAYIRHGMISLPQPVRVWYWGPMFRHDRPQAGRYRQFFQIGGEALGDQHPVIDAQLAGAAVAILRRVGLIPTMNINSTGCPVCRPKYIEQLVAYYRGRRSRLCEDCKRRLVRNPLRLLDCKEEQCTPLKEEAPQIVDSLCPECKEHFVRVLEYCDELEISYELTPSLVRGLDYYTKTVFELYLPNQEGRQDALGGGGRYDGLVELLGGRPTPAVGFSLGVDRIVNALKEKSAGEQSANGKGVKIFFAQLGEQARRQGLGIVERLRNDGIAVAEQFSKDGLKGQLERANRLGVLYTVILGQKEVLDGTLLIRDMEGGVQEIIDRKKVVEVLRKKLEGQQSVP